MKLRRLLPIILCICFATSCSKTATPVVSPSPNPTATAVTVTTNTPDPLVAQKAAMMYQQDFESGIPTGILFYGAKWNVQTEDSGNHILCNLPYDGWTDGTFGRDSWGDYAVQMKAKFQETLPQKGFLAIDIRVNHDFSESYSGVIDLQYGVAHLFFGEPYVDLGVSSFVPNPNTWYTMQIETAGNLLKYYINQQLIAEKTDNHRQQGVAGFGVTPQTKVCIDDIRVWSLAKDGSIAQAPIPLPASVGNQNKTIAERLASHKFPKLFVQNQELGPSDEFLNQASYWDIIVLDADTITTKPDYLSASGIIRQNNPNAVILTYFSAGDILPDDPNYIRNNFFSQLKPEWYMKDIHGKPYNLFFLGDNKWSQMFNLSTAINAFMPNFLNENVMKTGQVDGIFYDWISEDMGWLTNRTDNPPNSKIDINNSGQINTPNQINTLWQKGIQALLSESRKVFPAESLVIGNAGPNGELTVAQDASFDDTYKNLLNGRMLEGFLSNNNGWFNSMRAAALMDQASLDPKTPLFMAYGSENTFDYLRYTLASAMMLDGYFTMTHDQPVSNPTAYNVAWWYDEYAVDLKTGQAAQSLDAKGYLGLPLSDGYNADNKEEMLKTLLLNNDPTAEYKVWRRDFQNGIVLVNPSGSTKTIDLYGTYRKILGVKDPKFNDGSTVTKITLPAHSGIILLNMP